MSSFRTIQGNPVYDNIAPYIAVLVNDAKATVNSIYRGDEAASILHKHGKRTQRELYTSLHGVGVNPPGRSSHELRSDGRGFPGPVGRKLAWWQQGFDVNDKDVPRVLAAAHKYGWKLYQPYPGGAEFHHLNFAERPHYRIGSPLFFRLVRLRATLPRS